MDANNVVVVRGVVTSDPVVRTLPSGDIVTQIEMTTRMECGTTSVPVAVHGTAVTVVAGDEIVVTGHVSRRFFRVGGATQSRTEVIAARVVTANRRKTVATVVAAAAALLD
ncbi:MAG: hypothetical protein ABIP17_12150 [Ilumatobacteraceae bacterium]